MTIMSAPQHFTSVELDTEPMNPIIERPKCPRRRPLICQWQQDRQGGLICRWKAQTAAEAMAVDAIGALPPLSDDIVVPPSAQPRRLRALTDWIAVGLVAVAGGLETLFRLHAQGGPF